MGRVVIPVMSSLSGLSFNAQFGDENEFHDVLIYYDFLFLFVFYFEDSFMRTSNQTRALGLMVFHLQSPRLPLLRSS
jgi:hypothetical protein